VGAGYIFVVLPLQLPFLGQGLALGWLVAVTMPLISVANLIVLARTRRFERYVGVLVLVVLVFPASSMSSSRDSTRSQMAIEKLWAAKFEWFYAAGAMLATAEAVRLGEDFDVSPDTARFQASAEPLA
jgi:hypothetical protein